MRRWTKGKVVKILEMGLLIKPYGDLYKTFLSINHCGFIQRLERSSECDLYIIIT